MNLPELKALKTIPNSEKRAVIENLDLTVIKGYRKELAVIKHVQDGGKLTVRMYDEIIDGLCRYAAGTAYKDENGNVLCSMTVFQALVSRDVFGHPIPDYIRAMPEWEAYERKLN